VHRTYLCLLQEPTSRWLWNKTKGEVTTKVLVADRFPKALDIIDIHHFPDEIPAEISYPSVTHMLDAN
jgi:hypothetical protein